MKGNLKIGLIVIVLLTLGLSICFFSGVLAENLKENPKKDLNGIFKNLPNGKIAEVPEKSIFIAKIKDDIGEHKVIINKTIPRVRMKKWEDETYIDIKINDTKYIPLGLVKDLESPIIGKRLSEFSAKYKKLKGLKTEKEIKIYSLNISREGRNVSGIEYEITLNEKPISNKIKFEIDTKNLKFYYQPPLYLEHGLDKPNATCNATDCEGSHRPIDVVGSYAVYHESKSGDYSKMGGKNYMAGKAFHIYRPKIIDSKGNWVWGKLNIDEKKGILTIEIDQNFLDKAVYPVKIDPTFGYETAGSSIQQTNADFIAGSYFSVIKGRTADSISAYARDNDQYKYALYFQSNDSFVAETEEQTSGSGGPDFDWRTLNFATPKPSITSTTYWILRFGDYVLGHYYNGIAYDTDSGIGGYLETAYNGWPDPWSGYTTQDRKYSIYCTYTGTPPTYSDNSTNTTLAGVSTEFRVKWTDNYNLTGGGFIFSWYNGTNWTKTSNSGDLESGEQSQKGAISEEDFEGSFPPEGWQTGGDANWFQDSSTYYSGSHSAGSGDIDNRQNTWFSVTKTFSEDTTVTFYWKVSSESGYDYLVFCYDLSGCSRTTYTKRISGSVDWTQETQSVTAGTHEFKWMYAKDSSASRGSDMGWIDLVDFGSGTDTEANKTPVTYSDTITDIYETIHNITVSVYVSYYNNSGSQANGNTNPTLWLEVYNGTDWVDEGDFQVSGTGNYSKTITTASVLEGWKTESNRDIRISARYMDYNNSTHYDQINWTGVWVEAFSEQEFLNDSLVEFNSSNCVNDTVCWSNVTKTVTSQAGATIKWKVYAKDKADNWNETPVYSYITTSGGDTTAPEFELPYTNTIYLNYLGEDIDSQYGYWHNYSNANVSFTYSSKRLDRLVGKISATGLKPYATYQIKIRGRPLCKHPDGDDAMNDYIGYKGRWTCCNCSGTAVDRNRNDAQYEAYSPYKGDGSECIQGYIVFDFFTADSNGEVHDEKVSSDTSYHVGRCGGGVCDTISDAYLDYLDPNHPTIKFCPSDKVNGESESGRGGCNGLTLDSGTYYLELAITEESFHQGNWSTVLIDEADINFTIGETIQNNWTTVNITLIEESLDTFKFNWNGTNYTVFNDNLLFSYNFNNNSDIGDNSSQVVDIANNYNGTFYGTPTWTEGKFGKAINLNENGDYIDAGNVNLTGNQLTVSWWMKVDSNSGSTSSDNKAPIIIDWMVGSPYTDGTLLCYIKDDPSWSGGNFATNGTICTYHSSSGLNDLGTNFNDWYGSWHQVVYTLNGTDQRIYVDGKLDNNNTGSGDIVPNSQHFAIGWRNWQYGTWFNGSIDEIRVYNRALSADEVRMLYLSEFQKYNSTNWIFYNNVTNLTDGNYTYYAWANDTFGNEGQSEVREITVSAVFNCSNGVFNWTTECNIDSPRTCENSTIYAKNNVTISSNLTFKNVTFVVEHDGWVNLTDNGLLSTDNCTLTGTDEYSIFLYGNSSINDTVFTGYTNTYFKGESINSISNSIWESGAWIWEITDNTSVTIKNSDINYGFRVYIVGSNNVTLENLTYGDGVNCYGESSNSQFKLNITNTNLSYTGLFIQDNTIGNYSNIQTNDRVEINGNSVNYFYNCSLGGDYALFGDSSNSTFYQPSSTIPEIKITGSSTVTISGYVSINALTDYGDAWDSSAKLNRYYPIYAKWTNGTVIENVNMTIQDNSNVLSQGITDSNGYVCLNVTYNETTGEGLTSYKVIGNETNQAEKTVNAITDSSNGVIVYFGTPEVNLVSPADDTTWTSSNTVEFVYNVSASGNISNCTLYIKNWTDNGTYISTEDISAKLTAPSDNVFTIENGTSGVWGIVGAINDDPTDLIWYFDYATETTINFTRKPFITDREAGAWNGSIFIGMGGVNDTDILDKIYWFDPYNNHTEERTETLPYPLFRSKACSNGTHVWILGGNNASGSAERIIWRYDLGAGTITDTGNQLPNGGYKYAAQVDVDERCFIFGGRNATDTLDEIVLFNESSETASVVAHMPKPLYGLIAFRIGDYIYFGSGVNESGGGVNERKMWKFNINTYEITELGGGLHLGKATTEPVWRNDTKYGYIFGGTHEPSYYVTSNISKIRIWNYLTTTDTSVTKDTSQSFSYTLDNANYHWLVKCYDIYGYPGTSEERNLTVNYIGAIIKKPTTSLSISILSDEKSTLFKKTNTTISFYPSILKFRTLTKSLFDEFSISSMILRIENLIKSITNFISITEFTDRVIIYTREPDVEIYIEPTALRSLEANKELELTTQITPEMIRKLELNKELIISYTISIETMRELNLNRMTTLYLTLTPELTKYLGVNKNNELSLTITPHLLRELTRTRSSSLSITITPELIKELNLKKINYLTITLTPELMKILDISKPTKMTITLTPETIRILEGKREPIETFHFSGSSEREISLSRMITQSLSSLWTATHQKIAAGYRDVVETISLNAITDRVLNVQRTAKDTFTLSAISTKTREVVVNFVDTISYILKTSFSKINQTISVGGGGRKPVCGDGVCELGETNITCPKDCIIKSEFEIEEISLKDKIYYLLSEEVYSTPRKTITIYAWHIFLAIIGILIICIYFTRKKLREQYENLYKRLYKYLKKE